MLPRSPTTRSRRPSGAPGSNRRTLALSARKAGRRCFRPGAWRRACTLAGRLSSRPARRPTAAGRRARDLPCARQVSVVHNHSMAQRDIGLILMRQLASGLALPVWLSDENGDLLFFNEPAEKLLAQRFDDVGTLSLDDARRILSFRDPDGNALQ